MDIELIKALGTLPLEAVLIFIIIRQQQQIEKLMASIIESERNHASNLLQIVVGSRGLLVHTGSGETNN